jgi:hypothetical protein
VVEGLKTTDSPYDTYDNAHTQFGIDATRRPFMDRYLLDAKALARGAPTPITTLNFNPSGNPEGTALYTWRYGAKTPVDTARQTAEASMIAAGRRGDTLIYVRRGPVSSASGSAIPQTARYWPPTVRALDSPKCSTWLTETPFVWCSPRCRELASERRLY